MAGIFLSYRREDASGWAGRLWSSLRAALPGTTVFMDIDNIPPGVKFGEYIAQSVATCDVLLALVGPRWADEDNLRRLGQVNEKNESVDFVRLEIVAALKRNIRVIPTRVGGSSLPQRATLPEDMRELVDRNDYIISDRSWDDDCRRLVEALLPLIETSQGEEKTGSEAEVKNKTPAGASVAKNPEVDLPVRVGSEDSAAAAVRATTDRPSRADKSIRKRRYGWIAALALAVLAGTSLVYLLRPVDTFRTQSSPSVTPIPRPNLREATTQDAPQKSPSAKWRVYSTGRFDLESTYVVSLDNGKVGGDLGDADLFFQYDGLKGGPYLSPQNGAQIVQMDARSVDWCEQATFKTSPYPVSRLEPGMQFCARTRSGRPSVFQIENLAGEGDHRTITIGYTTWDR
jgi:TIR domain